MRQQPTRPFTLIPLVRFTEHVVSSSKTQDKIPNPKAELDAENYRTIYMQASGLYSRKVLEHFTNQE
jgi:hypothetical protein